MLTITLETLVRGNNSIHYCKLSFPASKALHSQAELYDEARAFVPTLVKMSGVKKTNLAHHVDIRVNNQFKFTAGFIL